MHRPPTEDARSAAAALLFRPKVFRDVRRWLERLGVPARDRDDVAGEVWLCAWRSWPTYDPEHARPERWLNRIMLHVCSHYHERASRRREVLLDEPLDVADPAPDALHLLVAEETRLGVLDAIDRLDLHEREVLVGHDIEEIPIGELVEELEVPMSTAYKRRARALAALRELVEPWEKE
ncbi:sigma-70 family RNA polymerase sigma factor [Sorangium sp. So ce260]|uniref:RNA polymerase sigma factor n=1 Tax=Sorangium sp. So ce260 TaxID=3133291 RepID=UPI003F63781F